jgi:Zn-dependent peptidase ImmA (M78 family)
MKSLSPVTRSSLENGQIRCGDYNANELIEKAAEVFAAEFIYPSQEFLECAKSLGLEIGEVTKEQVVELKRGCGAPVSYTFLQKRLEWFGFIEPKAFATVQFQKLEDTIHGVPIFRQPWFKARRKRRG